MHLDQIVVKNVPPDPGGKRSAVGKFPHGAIANGSAWKEVNACSFPINKTVHGYIQLARPVVVRRGNIDPQSAFL